MNTRKFYIIILCLGFVIVLLSIVIIFVSNSSSRQSSQQSGTSPTLIPVSVTPIPHTNPQVPYYTEGQKKLLDYVNNRRTLNTNDQQARVNLIALAHQNNGIVNKTDDYSLEYIDAADGFMTEILSPDVSTTKQEVNSWLEQQGMSAQGICYLPLGFYVSPQLAKLHQVNVIPFSPLPLGC